MAYSYQWHNAEKDLIARQTENGFDCVFPLDPDNTVYKEFLASGAVPAAYVEPYRTTEQKVNKLLSDYGLTRDEMRAALNAKSS